MREVTIRELRNSGGAVIDRVAAGESLTVTRDGRPVAELRPLPRPPVTSEMLIERAKRLQFVDPDRLRADIDAVIDTSL